MSAQNPNHDLLDNLAADAIRRAQAEQRKGYAESSMLNMKESQAASEALQRIIKHYEPALKAKMDPKTREKINTNKISQNDKILAYRKAADEVLKEFEAYLVQKIGDPLANKDPARRAYIHGHEKEHLRTALRQLIDKEPKYPNVYFESLLHKGSPIALHKVNDQLSIEWRTMLAYYWLAASDPNMEITDETLATEKKTKAELIDQAKENMATVVALVRRAHNGDYGLAIDSPIDSPSCAPGVFGRLAKSAVMHNPIAKLPIDPVPELPGKAQALVIDTFKKLDLKDAENYLGACNFAFGLSDNAEMTAAEKESVEKFTTALTTAKAAFPNALVKEYGKTLMTVPVIGIANRLADNIIKSLNIQTGGLPNADLFKRLESIVQETKRNNFLKEIKATIDKELEDLYQELATEWSTKISVIGDMTISVESFSNDKIDKSKNITDEWIKFSNEMIAKEKDRKATILKRGKDALEKKLKDNGIPFGNVLNENFELLPARKKGAQSMADIQSNWEKETVTFNQAYQKVRKERVSQAVLEFANSRPDLKKEKQMLDQKMQLAMKNLQEYIKSIDERASKDTNIETHIKHFDDAYKQCLALDEKIETAFLTLTDKTLFKLSLQEPLTAAAHIMRSTDKLFKEYETLKNKAESKKHTHEKYATTLEHTRESIFRLTISLGQELKNRIRSLNAGDISKDSLEDRQLMALLNAQTRVQAFIKEPLSPNEKQIDLLLTRARDVKAITSDLKKDLDTIGYRGKFMQVLTSIRNAFTSCINFLFGFQIKPSKSLSQEKVRKLVTFSELRGADKLREIEKDRPHLQIPSYGEKNLLKPIDRPKPKEKK